MTEVLTERQARLLSLVVREHIVTAQAVSSLQLLRTYDLGVSGATVRHDLAELAELGFLAQPHPAAGRVPTADGYRYFVEHLMRNAGLPEAEKVAIRRRFQRAGRDPERWMRLSAAAMAQCSRNAALVATPRRVVAPLRHIELVAAGRDLVQLVAVMADGSVRQWRWRPEHDVDQEALDRLGQSVNRAAHGGEPLPDLPGPEASPLEAAGLELLHELLPALRQPREPRLIHAGLAHIIDEPELAVSDDLRHVIELFEHGYGLERMFEVLALGRVEVLMGGEPPLEQIPHVTFVVAPFGGPDAPEGLVGIVGPRRLQYERAVPAVQFIARIMTRLYAGEEV